MIDYKIAVLGIIGLNVLFPLVNSAYGQEIIIVNQTQPCFLNFTAGSDMWENCGADEDWLAFALMPFEWVTGGYFSFLIVGLFVVITYQKYQNVAYPIAIGVFMLPFSFFLIPQTFYIWAVVMAGVTFGIFIWYVFIRQTKEYGA